MKNQTTRQQYLSLVSRLYELAAEFTDAELKAMLANLSPADGPGVHQAINALMQLHHTPNNENHSIHKQGRVPTPAPAPAPAPVEEKEHKGRRQFSGYLGEIFADKSMFPALSDIAAVVPGHLSPRPKEARSRYIGRVIEHASRMSKQEQDLFQRSISAKLAHQPNTFISQWKKLIKEL